MVLNSNCAVNTIDALDRSIERETVLIENGRLQGYSNPVFDADYKLQSVAVVRPQNEKIFDEKSSQNSVKSEGCWIQASNGVGGGITTTKEYEPYDYCTSDRPTSYTDTVLHILKAAIGTGILAIPSAFKESGYVVGVIGVLVMSLLYTYCMHLLVNAERELCRRRRTPNMTYANTVHAAFEERLPKQKWLANGGQFFANFFFMIYECGGCAIYIVFISTNVKQILDHYLDSEICLRTLMVYVTIPLLLLCWIPNLKSLAPLSAIANAVQIFCFASVFYYVFKETPSLEGKVATGPPQKLPVYFTTVLFSVACTGLILPLKNEMKKPAKFGSWAGVLNVAMVPMAMLYATFGLLGYLKFGVDTQGSITLNLPQHEILAQCIKGFYSLSVFMSYCLCYYVVLDIVWINFFKNKVQKCNLMWEYVCRTCICLATLIMAIAVPNLEIFISLVGALGISTTSLVIPILVHTITFWDQCETNGQFLLFFAKNTVLFLISIVIFVSGIAISINDAVALYS